MKMNLAITLAAVCCGVAFLGSSVQAQLTIPGADGTDGTFFPLETNTVVNLAEAVSGKWDQASPQPGKGVYDAENWVIVFKYRNVVIPRGFTVTFSNHPSRAPVVWLVQNNANIEGVVDVSGKTNVINGLREPGPGGFRGGAAITPPLSRGAGLGPGGGLQANGNGLSGVYNYGNARILPLLGGSGGSGDADKPILDVGASGGGAILIAARQAITINGRILADGGPSQAGDAYGGSGGGIKLIANRVDGSGLLRAVGSPDLAGYLPLVGRIRVETSALSDALTINPPTIAVPPQQQISIVPPTGSPKVTVISIGALNAPPDPVASVGNSGADLILATASPVDVLIQTQNVPTNSTVTAMFKPKYHGTRPNGQPSTFSATAKLLSGDGSSAIWTVREVMPIGHFVVQARALTP